MCVLSLVWGTLFAQEGTDVTFDFLTDEQAEPADDSSDLDLFNLSGVSWDAITDEGTPAMYTVENGDGDFTADKTATKDGVSITIPARNDDKTPLNRIYYSYVNGKTNIRVYQGIVTISAPGHKITAITFSNGKWNNNNNVSSGSYSSGKWTGNAETVEFTIGGSTQLANITVTLDGEPGEEPEVDDRTEKDLNHGSESNPISVAEAVEAAKVIGREDNNNVSEEEFYVTGTITKINTNKAGTVTFTYSTGTATYYIGDDSGNSFEIYKGKYFEGYSCTGDLPDIEVGIDVVVRGKIKYYQGKQPEFDEGSILVLLDGWKPGALPDPVTYAVNVEEALDAAAELDKNATSYDYYKVTGYVVGTPVYKRNKDGELFGDVNLYIADEINGTPTFYIYQANNKNNELFTESDLNLFTAGDKVTFIGNLKNYVKKDKETGEEADPVYELVEGYLLNYEVSPTVTVTIPSSGLATFCPARPILVEEDQEVYIAKELQEDKVLVERVSGKIAANVGLLIKGEESVTFDVEEQGEEPEDNLLVGVLDPTDLEEGDAYILVGGAFYPCTAGTFPAGKAYLPAQAVSGAKVIFFGGDTTGISEVKAQDSNSEIYTIGGIRVKNAQQKGIYIINGKKVVK